MLDGPFDLRHLSQDHRAAACRCNAIRVGAVHSFESYIEQTNRIETSAQLQACFEGAMAWEGFENFFNATIIAGKVSHASWLKLPVGHLETYIAERWERIDPVVP